MKTDTNSTFADLQMGAVYLAEIGDTDALNELKEELEQLITENPQLSQQAVEFRTKLIF